MEYTSREVYSDEIHGCEKINILTSIDLPNKNSVESRKEENINTSHENTFSDKGHTQANNKITSSISNDEYIYTNDSGEVVINEISDDKYKVSIRTVNSESLHTCDYTGVCSRNDNNLYCKNEDSYTIVNINIGRFDIEVLNDDYFFCGQRASIQGLYMVKR